MATRIPIPLGQQRQSSPLGMPAARAPMIGVQDSTGQAVAGIGRAVGQLGDAAQRLEREDSIAWVSKASSDDQIKWLQRLSELEETAAPGAPDFTPNLINEFDQYSNEAVANAPESVRAAYRESLTRQRTYLGHRAVTFEAGRRREHITTQYTSGLESDAAAIALDPALYDERRATRMAALNASDLPAAIKQKLVGDTEASMAYAAGAATIDRDPHGTLSAMQAAAAGESVQGFSWINRLDASRIQQLRTRAQTQADRIDNKARIEQEQATSRAIRAVGEMEKQIATGVPPRTDDMLRWAGMVSGTEHEGMYKTLLESQQEVQDVLRLPLAEQQAYLQKKQQALQKGANTTDIANAKRLESAVTSNMEMMRTAPLAWIENRTGTSIERLNMGQLSDPAGVAQVGQRLRERADANRAVQRANEPGTVAMAPLFAEEAQQLNGALSQASAREKRDILGGLYWATGEEDIYQGVISQVEGLNPFLGRVGRLAASYETAKLQGGWFSKDVIQSVGDSAAVAIHGDEILRAGGKAGNINYPVPKEEEFIDALRNQVGDLYRGTLPGDSGAKEFMQDAYAIKAYYVGKAAQEGSLSADVDSDRLSQAVTAIIGEPVDYNGGGTVLSPWGISKDDFTRRASSRVESSLKERGMLDVTMQSSLSSVGLIGVGDGFYAATMGGIPMRDPRTGELVTVRMQPDADTGRDAFGRPLSDQIPGSASGPVEAGNIDLSNRPVVRNADGSISTVRSMSFNEDGKEILIPTVSDDGRILDDDAAIALYRRTGKHLGKFKTPAEATRYAETLHDQQEQAYRGRP